MGFDLAGFRKLIATPGQDRTTMLLGAAAVIALTGVVFFATTRGPEPVAGPAPPAPVAEAPVSAEPVPQPEVAVIPPPATPEAAAVPPGPDPSIASVDRTPAGGRSVAAGKPGMEIPAPAAPETKAAEAKPAPDKKATKMAKAAPPPESSPTPPSAQGPMPSLNAQAQGYVRFARDIDTISNMKLQSPTEVRDALGRLKKHQPKEMTEGWIAYGAGLAADNKEFAASLAKEIEKRGRDGVEKKLATEPSFLLKLDGAYAALSDIFASVASDTAKLNTLQQRFITTAYEFQKIKKWGALETSKSNAFAALSGPLPEEASNYFRPAGLFGGGGKAKAPEVVPTGPTQSALELAARLAIGSSATPASMATPVGDKGLEQCLRWAKLNLNQCMAASHFPSEEAYCTGKHALAEVSACWSQLLPAKS